MESGEFYECRENLEEKYKYYARMKELDKSDYGGEEGSESEDSF